MSLRSCFRGTLVCVGAVSMLAGCRAIGGAKGDSPDQQRATIRNEQGDTLSQLYAAKPETREKILKAPGYAYFGNINVNVLLLSTENGYGVVHDNAANKDTFMKMAGAGVGLGAGVKDYRVIFIFNDAAVMRQFVDKGWDFGGQADAAAKAGQSGGATSAAATGTQVAGMEIYQFTKTGLALQATVQGTKFWRDDKLNR